MDLQGNFYTKRRTIVPYSGTLLEKNLEILDQVIDLKFWINVPYRGTLFVPYIGTLFVPYNRTPCSFSSDHLTPRFPKRQIGAFQPLRRDCARSRDC